MKLIIAGSRDFAPESVFGIIDELVPRVLSLAGHAWVTRVLSGGCRGVDRAGELWAHREGIQPIIYPPRTGPDGRWLAKSEGPKRNQNMAEDGDALLLICKPDSIGSASMYRKAMESGLAIVRAIRRDDGIYSVNTVSASPY